MFRVHGSAWQSTSPAKWSHLNLLFVSFMDARISLLLLLLLLLFYPSFCKEKEIKDAHQQHTQKEKRLLFFFHVVEPCIKPSQKVKKKKFLHRNRKMTTFISATTRYTKRSVSSSYLQCNNLRNFLLFILLARSSKSNNIFILLFVFFSKYAAI